MKPIIYFLLLVQEVKWLALIRVYMAHTVGTRRCKTMTAGLGRQTDSRGPKQTHAGIRD